MTLLVGSLAATKVRVVTPWTGVWFADVEAILGDTDTVPTGKTIVTVGASTLAGTVDPRSSGRFGATAHVRVVGGGNAWDTVIPAIEFHNDGGVQSLAVLQAAAGAAGEVAVDNAPTLLGSDYVRFSGPATRALAGRPWYVDATGITQVGAARPPATAPADLQVTSWDPTTEVVELTTDSLILPGLSLTDTDGRWDGAIVLRDVEQVFDGDNSRVTAVCSANPVSRAQVAFARAVVETSGITFATRYRYRVVSQGADGRLTLQAVAKAPGAPDSQLIVPWYGVPGISAKVAPGSIAHVIFVERDPTQPVVVGFDATAPLELDISAPLTKVNGAVPAALAPHVTDALNAIMSGLNALATALLPGTTPLVGSALSAAITTAVGTGSPAAAALQAAEQLIPSTTLQAG